MSEIFVEICFFVNIFRAFFIMFVFMFYFRKFFYLKNYYEENIFWGNFVRNFFFEKNFYGENIFLGNFFYKNLCKEIVFRGFIFKFSRGNFLNDFFQRLLLITELKNIF